MVWMNRGREDKLEGLLAIKEYGVMLHISILLTFEDALI